MIDVRLSVTTGLQGTQKLTSIMLFALAACTALGCVDAFMSRRAALPHSPSMAMLYKVRAIIVPRLSGATAPVARWLRGASRRLVALSARRTAQGPQAPSP